MTTYFGFIPNEELNTSIARTIEIVARKPEKSLYPLQLSIAKHFTDEILNNLIMSLVRSMDDAEQKGKMEKVANMICSTINLMNKQIIIEQSNENITDGLNFLLHKSMFIDNEGNKRIGFKLSEEDANTIIKNLNIAKKSDKSNLQVQIAISVIIKTNLNHFIKEFSKELHLNTVREKTVSLAESAIHKSSKVIVNKYLPDVSQKFCMRIISHFEKSIVIKKD